MACAADPKPPAAAPAVQAQAPPAFACPQGTRLQNGDIVWANAKNPLQTVTADCTFCAILSWEMEGGVTEADVVPLLFTHVSDTDEAVTSVTMSLTPLSVSNMRDIAASGLDEDVRNETWASFTAPSGDRETRRMAEADGTRHQLLIGSMTRQNGMSAVAYTVSAITYAPPEDGVTGPEEDTATIFDTLKCSVRD